MAPVSPSLPPKTLPAANRDQVHLASRTRYRVLGLTFLVAFVMYVDRVCMGTAAPIIMPPTSPNASPQYCLMDYSRVGGR